MINLVKLKWLEVWHDKYAELLTDQELAKEIGELETISSILNDTR